MPYTSAASSARAGPCRPCTVASRSTSDCVAASSVPALPRAALARTASIAGLVVRAATSGETAAGGLRCDDLLGRLLLRRSAGRGVRSEPR